MGDGGIRIHILARQPRGSSSMMPQKRNPYLLEHVQGRSASTLRLAMPNRHCLLVDLSPFDLDNPNEVFVPTDEPSGMIEATLARAIA